VPVLATLPLGVEPLGGYWVRSDPVVTILTPVGVVQTPMVTVTWSYSSALSHPQTSFRALLKSGSGSTVLEDSGDQAGAGGSWSFGFLLQGFTNYRIEVQASDGFDTGSDEIEFSTELADASDFPDELRVGSIYEVAINGVGFMLADAPESEAKYTRRSSTLDAQRFADGDTPFSEAIERYSLLKHQNWSGGAGQRLLYRPSSDPSKYWDSEGINPFVEGQLSLLHQSSLDMTDTYANQLACIAANHDIFVLVSDTQLCHIDEPGMAETTFNVGTGVGVVSSLTSDGNFWYATDGANIFRNNVAVTGGAAWSTVDVTEIQWCSDRLAGFDTVAVPPNVTTFSSAGVEEVAGGRFSFPDATLAGLTAGDGYMWWGVNRGREAQVYAWKLGSTDGAFIALSLPAGERVTSLFSYLGNVFIASHAFHVHEMSMEPEDMTHIYRCVPAEGKLTPELIAMLPPSNRTFWAGQQEFVAFTWKDMTMDDGFTGIGVIDLGTGGYTKWHTSASTAEAKSLCTWHGEWAFTVSTQGLYTVVDHEDFVPEGWLITSSADLGSSVSKIFDEVTVTSRSLVGTITVEWSRDTLESWNLLGTFQGDGATQGIFQLEKQLPKVGFRITLTEGVGTPILESLVTQLHPLTFADQIQTLPLRCSNRVVGQNGQEIDFSGPARGDQLARFVENLVPSRVKLQDVDWPTTKEVILCEAVGAETSTLGEFDPHLNRRVNSHVVMLTLRRRL